MGGSEKKLQATPNKTSVILSPQSVFFRLLSDGTSEAL